MQKMRCLSAIWPKFFVALFHLAYMYILIFTHLSVISINNYITLKREYLYVKAILNENKNLYLEICLNKYWKRPGILSVLKSGNHVDDLHTSCVTEVRGMLIRLHFTLSY